VALKTAKCILTNQFYLPLARLILKRNEPYLPLLPSCWASAYFGRYQIILFGKRATLSANNWCWVVTWTVKMAGSHNRNCDSQVNVLTNQYTTGFEPTKDDHLQLFVSISKIDRISTTGVTLNQISAVRISHHIYKFWPVFIKTCLMFPQLWKFYFYSQFDHTDILHKVKTSSATKRY